MAQQRTFTDLLTHLETMLGQRDRISLEDLQHAIGERSFGPLLLVMGLAAASPLGLIPGLPTAFAVAILLVAGQLVIGRRHFWLPPQISHRSAPKARVRRSLAAMRRPAGWLDRLLRPRLNRFVGGFWTRGAALACIVLAFAIPPLELVPFGVLGPATAITAFGLALTARDGALMLIALLASAVSLGLVAFALFR